MSEEELNEKNKIQQLSTTARELYPEMDYEEAEKFKLFQAVKKSFKLLVVRHPFERLLSAYRDKLENTNLGFEHGTKHFYKKYGAKIVKKYRAAGKEPTFKEFVRYLIDIDLLNYADDHWIPYYLFCTPCLVEYDFVAKVETLWRDQSYVINSTRLRGKIRPGWRHSTKNGHGNESIAAVYFSQLTRSDVERLYQKYRLDFELFDYDVKPYLAYAG
ncbi:hypothetical protein AAG570_003521 [Ranatra chinensis]|uniref:Carbohydrate sulfotransferase n=1 Tax=Ranatra chinensis TaxID=642074 RepID=A0ABD0Y3Z9_9HEMI